MLIYVAASRLVTKRQRLILVAGAAVTALLAGILALGQQRYFDAVSGDPGLAFEIKPEYTFVFGNIKVLELTPNSAGAQRSIAFL